MERPLATGKTKRNQSADSQRTPSDFRKRWRDRKYRRKVYRSASLCGHLFTVGCIFSQVGPSLLDLQIITNTSLEKASAFITSGAAGFLSGTLVCGVILEKVNADILMFLGGIVMAATTFISPFCANFELMNLMRFLAFFSVSIVNTGCIALIIVIWGTEGQHWMQLLHFCFAAGGVISPLYTEPFLAPNTGGNETLANGTTLNMTTSLTSNSSLTALPRETNVKYAFIISGCFALLTSIPFVPFYIMNQEKITQKKKEEETRNQRKLPRKFIILTTLMVAILLFLHLSVEITFASFLMTFLVREYAFLSKSKATFITSIYWASFASGRLLNVILSKAFPILRLLAIFLTLMVVTFTGFLISAQHAIVDALIGFSVMAGLSMSGVFGSLMSWTEAELLKVSGFITGAIIFISSLAWVLHPIILGYLMEHESNMWFTYILLGGSVLAASMFVTILVYSRCFLNRKFGPCMPSNKGGEGLQETFLDDDGGEPDRLKI